MSGRRLTSRANERIEEIHDYWIDVDNREIWIHGIDDGDGTEPGVDFRMATKVIKNLHFFRSISEDKPVTVHLHTCGGDVIEGLAIYDVIKSMPYHVTMISYTHARSMSSYILQAADTRILLPSSYFMAHLGTIALNDGWSNAKSQMAYLEKQEEILMRIYLESAKNGPKFQDEVWTDKKIRSHLERLMDRKGDVFLSAEEAIEWGFADGILENWNQ